MLWAVLLQSEYRRVKKAALELARTNPIILVAIVALAAGSVAIAVRFGEFFAILSLIPGGISGVTILLLLIGLTTGATLSVIGPKAALFDEQFRLVPVRHVTMFVGLRGLPIILLATIFTVPMLAMTWRLYSLVGVPTPIVWAGVFGALYVSAILQGAAILEAFRGYQSWSLFGVATVALMGTIGVSFLLSFGIHGPWVWLAIYLPDGSLNPGGFAVVLPPSYVAAIGAAGSMALSAIAWIIYSLRPDRPPRMRGIEFTAPMGRNVPSAFAVWALLTTLRQGHSRNALALTMLTGIGAAVFLYRWHSGTSSILVVLLAALLFMMSAGVVLAFSEDRWEGTWLIKTVPASGYSIGLAWSIATSVLTIAVGFLVVAPMLVGVGYAAIQILLLFLVAYACSVTVVGRLLPWRSKSYSDQILTAFALMFGVAVAYYLGITIGTWIGGIIEPIVPVVAFALLGGTGISSVAIEWLDS